MVTKKKSILIYTIITLVLILMLFWWLGDRWYVNYAPVQPFLIYYGGIPTQNKQITTFVDQLTGYPIVILGDGLSDSAPSSSIIRLAKKSSPNIAFFGYISIGVTHQAGNLSVNEVKSLLKQWKQIGASGVLYDTAGPDFGVSYKRLSQLVALAHQYGMRIIVNSWYPQAVLHVGLTRHDGYLAENWYVAEGHVRSQPVGASYISLIKQEGIPIFMTATGGSHIQSLSLPTIKAWVKGSKKVAQGNYIAISDQYYSSDTDYIESAKTLKNIIRSFFPFGL